MKWFYVREIMLTGDLGADTQYSADLEADIPEGTHIHFCDPCVLTFDAMEWLRITNDEAIIAGWFDGVRGWAKSGSKTDYLKLLDIIEARAEKFENFRKKMIPRMRGNVRAIEYLTTYSKSLVGLKSFTLMVEKWARDRGERKKAYLNTLYAVEKEANVYNELHPPTTEISSLIMILLLIFFLGLIYLSSRK